MKIQDSTERPIRISEVAIWGTRIFLTGGMAMIMYSGTAKINELIDRRLLPVIDKHELKLERLSMKLDLLHSDVQRVNSALEVIAAVNRERERESKITK